MNKFRFIVSLLFWCIGNLLLSAQGFPLPTSKDASFECDLVLDIYNGLKDWTPGGKSYSGGQLLNGVDKKSKGAVTVANLNNTDGDFNSDGTENVDSEDNSVVSTAGVGRNEIDLIKLVIRKRVPLSPLPPGTPDIEFKVPFNVKIWLQPTKEIEVVPSMGVITIPASEFEISQKTYYAEAISPSTALRDMRFEINVNGNIDYALATAVWVDFNPGRCWFSNTSTPIPGSSDLPEADSQPFKDAINITWIDEIGNRYGMGPHFAGQIAFGNNQHPLSSILPGFQNKENGGRIMFEFRVRPTGAESLVDFDCTRQKKVRGHQYLDFIPEFIQFAKIDFPFENNKDNELPNDDINGLTDEDNIPLNSLIYSSDKPASHIIDVAKPDLAFKINKITFLEFVRLRIKESTGIPFGGEKLQGSRCSNKIAWHCVYYLRRSTTDRKLFADIVSASSSEPNKSITFVGNGTANIVILPISTTDTYTLMYSIDDTWLILDSHGNGTFVDRNADGLSWTINYNGLIVTIFEGGVPFSENDTYFFSTFNSASKLFEIGLGSIDVTTPP